MQIAVGGVYLVKESALTLLPAKERTMHKERRRFVVLSGPEKNSQSSWPVVLGCPVSASTTFKTEFDVHLAQNEAGASKKCWIRVPALQPLLKTDLEELTGFLDAAKLEMLQARVIDYMGLADENNEA